MMFFPKEYGIAQQANPFFAADLFLVNFHVFTGNITSYGFSVFNVSWSVLFV